MIKILHIAIALVTIIALVACGPRSAPKPAQVNTAVPSATPAPSPTPRPSPTPFPTASEPAPEETFTNVGNVAELSGSHGISGRATVAGLQTLIIQGFNYDGKAKADIRLVLGKDYTKPAVILLELQPQVYQDTLLVLIVPSSVKRGSADSIAVYSPETNEAYATGIFR